MEVVADRTSGKVAAVRLEINKLAVSRQLHRCGNGRGMLKQSFNALWVYRRGGCIGEGGGGMQTCLSCIYNFNLSMQ